MLLNTVQVLTSAFLVFAGTYFIYCALKNKNDWSGLISNLVVVASLIGKGNFWGGKGSH